MMSSTVNTEDRDMSALNIHVSSAVQALSTALVWQGLSFTDYFLHQKAFKQYCTATNLPDRATSEVPMSRASYEQDFPKSVLLPQKWARYGPLDDTRSRECDGFHTMNKEQGPIFEEAQPQNNFDHLDILIPKKLKPSRLSHIKKLNFPDFIF